MLDRTMNVDHMWIQSVYMAVFGRGWMVAVLFCITISCEAAGFYALIESQCIE